MLNHLVGVLTSHALFFCRHKTFQIGNQISLKIAAKIALISHAYGCFEAKKITFKKRRKRKQNKKKQ